MGKKNNSYSLTSREELRSLRESFECEYDISYSGKPTDITALEYEDIPDSPTISTEELFGLTKDGRNKKRRKLSKKELKSYTKEYRAYLDSLSNEELEKELDNIDFTLSIPSQEEIYERTKKEKKIAKKIKKEFKKYMKKKNPKTISEYEKYENKFNKYLKKKQKKLMAKGKSYGYMFDRKILLDEDKLINNLKRLTKNSKERSDRLNEYLHSMYGDVIPDNFKNLQSNVDKARNKTKKFIRSMEDIGLDPMYRDIIQI